uniref:Uncharacterized protein n=1 Tax=Stomoxys calcitrans TaxID=35570 RepID=A0A1I8NRT4_STOCA
MEEWIEEIKAMRKEINNLKEFQNGAEYQLALFDNPNIKDYLNSTWSLAYLKSKDDHIEDLRKFINQLESRLAKSVENTTKQLGEIQEFLVTNVTKEAQHSAGMLEDFIRQEREKLEETQELLFGNLTKEAQHSVRLAELIQEEKKLREEIQQRLDMHLNGEAQNSARMMEELVEEVNEMRHSLAKDAFKIELMEELMLQQKTQLEENQKVLEIQLTVETQNSARMVEELVQEVDEMRNNLAKEAHNIARLQELILQQTKQLEDNQKLWDKHLTEDTQNSTQRVEELVQEVNEMRHNLTKEAQHSARLYQQQHTQLGENLKLLEKRLNEEAQTSVRMVEGLAQEVNEMRHNMSTQLTKEAQNSARLEELIQQQKAEFEENQKLLENHLIDEAHNSGRKINELAQEIKEIRNEVRTFHTFQNVAERQFAFIDSLNLKENFNATSYTANLKSKNDHIEDLRKTIKQLESRLAEYGKSQNCTAPKNFYFVQRGQP